MEISTEKVIINREIVRSRGIAPFCGDGGSGGLETDPGYIRPMDGDVGGTEEVKVGPTETPVWPHSW